ncbi:MULTISPECIES: hypothetical protein [Methanobacterium]|uniref:Uncharacterized protein n=1 Tax=Methanobacterium veterum TaxID=408577 RepID=A0A9E4ZZV1_9EURY|nr:MULTISPECIES: hypothetical protein [Methanobacterium]MCZ3365420.1 hypothetical protein [Methanobacterium veterum]MCZ3373171.1 hypothetical protein [Methanobacterium veterum]
MIENKVKNEDEEIIKLPLSQKRIDKFKKHAQESRKFHSSISKLLKQYTFPAQTDKKLESFGSIVMISKYPFVEINGPIYYDDNGRDFGRIIAQEKDELIIKDILKVNNIRKSNNEKIKKFLDICIDEMEDKGYNPILMIVPRKFDIKLLENEFKRQKLKINGEETLERLYRNLIIKNQDIPENIILILDIEKGFEYKENENLFIDVRIPTEEDIKLYLESFPNSHENFDVSVRLKIADDFHFKIIDKNAILKLEIN